MEHPVIIYSSVHGVACVRIIKDQMQIFQKHSKDLRTRNLERVRLMALAEAEKKQKMMLGIMGIFIILAVGIDGDPFDELFSVLRLLWFLPILCAAGAGYFYMYGTPPPYAMEAIQFASSAARQIHDHIKVDDKPEGGATAAATKSAAAKKAD